MSEMRILLVNTRHYFGGGDSTYTFNLAELLRKKGHEVSFFAMQDERNLPDPNSDLFVSNIDFRELNKNKNPLTGIKVLSRSIYSVEARQKFSLLLDRVKPDIVHLQNIHAHITPSIIFEAKKRGIPIVWTLHDYKLICPNSHFLIDKTNEICEDCCTKGYFSAIKNKCKKGSMLASTMAGFESEVHKLLKVKEQIDAFLCPSEFLQQKLLDNGFPEDKVFYLPLFLPDSAFSMHKKFGEYLLFLGKLEPLKGIYPLLEAAHSSPEVRIILAGRVDESFETEIFKNLPGNCEYAGFKVGSELENLKKNAKALVIPSVWYENQPFSILEMFALGKPVIASDLGGMRELVGDDERGWLVQLNDIQGLSSTMKIVNNSDEEVINRGKKAFEYCQKYNSENSHYQTLLSIYKKNILS